MGTMTFGGAEGMWKAIGGLGEATARDLVARALDAGVNFFDTADGYGNGDSETIVGRVLGKRRDRIVLATKAGFPTGDGPNDRGASRAHLVDAIEASLRRLGTDWIDLYIVHRFDLRTPLEETMRALEDLVRAGKVRYLGASNFAAWQLVKANAIAAAAGGPRFESAQMYYSLAARDIEREVIPMMRSEGVGLTAWSPLHGGALTGKYAAGAKPPAGSRREGFDLLPTDWARVGRVVDAAREIGAARGASVAQVALAWLLAQEAVTSVIIGAKTAAQLEDNLGATRVALSAEDRKRLDDASALSVEYPGWFLAQFADV
jgi:aryl-alcohol dehydrogenase-like predicted oxidoreductase